MATTHITAGPDGCRESATAARWTAPEAELRGIALNLVHVDERPDQHPPPPDPRPEITRRADGTLLRDATQDLHRLHPDLEITTQSLRGGPSETRLSQRWWMPTPTTTGPSAARTSTTGCWMPAMVAVPGIHEQIRHGIATLMGGMPNPWHDKYPSVEVNPTHPLCRAAIQVFDASSDSALVVVGRRIRAAAVFGTYVGAITHALPHHSAAPVAVIAHD
ncbi:hypothetical protein AB0M68_31930 [Streptomyces sp. NPDC051453]|uniref:hypothetical protein n=1 Tax=Streptomyces sp. NPDC051453 TaxID=3154941 RepID=UPI0034281A23